MAEITGAYPGGPPRHQPDDGSIPQPEVELVDGESVEASRESRITKHRKGRRNRRVIIGLVTSIIAAASAGAYYGVRSSRTAERQAEEEMMKEGELDVNEQADRILNELWRMEDIERGARR